ncbi:hypothetical protein RF11_02348 [Thelohanellus kitauei]|uniref:Uncharacterized protein n=1 Tax=Thelohanellus kitauei TaxID=669202 RepID=A0A0C2N166_THEKT|nr:hypothetical protein RF11_02348 [Thelohanellus kitauei]
MGSRSSMGLELDSQMDRFEIGALPWYRGSISIVVVELDSPIDGFEVGDKIGNHPFEPRPAKSKFLTKRNRSTLTPIEFTQEVWGRDRVSGWLKRETIKLHQELQKQQNRQPQESFQLDGIQKLYGA